MEKLTLVVGPVTSTTQDGTVEVDLLAADDAATRHMDATARTMFARRAIREPVIWPTVLVRWSKRTMVISGVRA